jgi:6-phosphogluconate dehydrogenase (decarboxylating)
MARMNSGPDLLIRAWDRLVHSKRNWLRLPERADHLGHVVEFLAVTAERADVVFHGSNTRTIEVFEPREQSTFHGDAVSAVFATRTPFGLCSLRLRTRL